MSERQFVLPRRRARWWTWAVAVGAHLVLLGVLLVHYRHIPVWRDIGAHILRDDSPPRIALARPRSLPIDPVVRTPRATGAPLPTAESPTSGAVPPSTAVATVIAPAVVDSPPAGAALHPQYGSGRLWVHPLVESPRRIASTLTGKTPAELSDSAVTAMVQTYLNEMADENRDHPSPLPSWTTKIGGKTVGVDSKWIYLGPLKVPTALLAFLPLKVQANPTQAEFNARLAQMRGDLMEAARRSATYDDFKQAVKQLHEETERERQFKKNQRTPPDTGKHE